MRKTNSYFHSAAVSFFNSGLVSGTILVVLFAFSFPANAMGIKPPKVTSPGPIQAPIPKPPVQLPPVNTGFKALWEGQHAGSSEWTSIAQAAVQNYGTALLKGPSDVSAFCPMYDRLGTLDRVNFWVQLIAAMSKYESGFNPASRMAEALGIDAVTKKQVESEGLLQLSYQDELNYGKVVPAGICHFDYNSDSKLPVTDVRRSILDPRKNLDCGIAILNRQVARYGQLAIASGAYWSVIKSNSKYSKLAQIKAITNALPFCK
jgi:hypothetical protein